MSETNPERPATPTPLARERLATEIRRLAVVLDAEAIAVAGDRLATLCEDIAAEVERQKRVKAELKETIGAMEARRGKLARAITTRRDERDVECAVEAEFLRGVAEVIRLDTRELVETRSLRGEEWTRSQRGLFGEPPGQAPAG